MIWAAYAVGAFYVFAGLIVINAGRLELFLDHALKTLTGAPTPLAERLRAAYAIAVGVLMLAGGAALLLTSRWAVALFVACSALQAVYLLWATRALPPRDPDAAKGRRGTFNAFVVYGAATSFVVWLHLKDLLQ